MRIDFDGGYYEGNVTDTGKKLGKGKCFFDDGSSYSGTFTGSTYNGFGWYYYANGSKYFGQWQNGKCSGYGVMTYSNGDKHYGYWYDDERHGFGVTFYTNGSVFIGDWVNGVRESRGHLAFTDGSHINGRYVSGKLNGKCTRVYNDASFRYELWDDGEMTGSTDISDGLLKEAAYGEYGICSIEDCFGYEGEATYYGAMPYSSDEPEYAMIKYDNGDYYFGLIQNGAPNGVGYYRWNDQSYCYGCYLNGLRHGYCTFISKELKYYGNFVEDQREGFGVSFFGDGKIYVGQYRNSKENGEGSTYLKNDGIYSGYFFDGECHNLTRSLYYSCKPLANCVPVRGTTGYTIGNTGNELIFTYSGKENMGSLIIFDDGSLAFKNYGAQETFMNMGDFRRYILANGKAYIRHGKKYTYYGDFVNEKMSGVGTLTYENGSRYRGELIRGEYNGKGEFIYSDGTVYRGEFRDGQQCGEGTMYFTDGDVASGTWQDDENADYLELTSNGRKHMCKMVEGNIVPY